MALQAKSAEFDQNSDAEREADAVAAQVMRMPLATEISATGPRRIQAKTIQPNRSGKAPPPALSGFVSGGRNLPASARSFFEPRFGRNFSDVRVHAGPKAEAAAAGIGARAFTIGSSIVFGEGEYNDTSEAGRTLLAHELTHVVQQSKGAKSVQRQVRIDPFVASQTAAHGLNPDLTAAFFGALRPPPGLRLNTGVTRFSVNATPYTNPDSIAQNLNLPDLSERDLRTIPQPNLRDPVLDRVWADQRLVRHGRSGKDAQLVQEALLAWGRGLEVPVNPLPGFGADGKFFDESKTGVELFQRSWGGINAPLDVDGLVGPLTIAALEEAMQQLNTSEYFLNATPDNHFTGTINFILAPAAWSTIATTRSTLEARALSAGFHVNAFSGCTSPNNPVNFTVRAPAGIDQAVLVHEQQHEVDIGTSITNQIAPWDAAVAELVANQMRFRAPTQAAAETQIYAELSRRMASGAGDICSIGRALETDLVAFESALHGLPNSAPRFTGFTTNSPQCTAAQANIDFQGGPRAPIPAVMTCTAPPLMTVTQQVPT